VAVQPGRCGRFIGTLLARISYAPRTLRMEHEETKKRRDESLAADLENKNAILLEQFRDRSHGKNCDGNFQDFDFYNFAIFEISNFAILDF
jgi:hypothetical protein